MPGLARRRRGGRELGGDRLCSSRAASARPSSEGPATAPSGELWGLPLHGAAVGGQTRSMPFPFTRGLPDVGASETDTLDFKTELKPLPDKKSADRFECAKDVAAFASTSGGTLLVGAVESQHVLQRYKPVSKETAAWIEREYEEAVRDRCAPPPSMRTERFERDGGFVVAIHVEAFPSPVAVKVKGNGEDGWGADA